MPALKIFANRAYLFFDAVRFQESIFALPFAYTGMLLAAGGLPSLAQFSWITIAMISARTLGMSANRIIDMRIDSQNPRTSGRHLPAGLIALRDMATLLVASMIVLLSWAYVSAFILILGAEISSEYGRMRNGVDRG